MATITSSIVKPNTSFGGMQTSTPATLALNNKINPPPLQPLVKPDYFAMSTPNGNDAMTQYLQNKNKPPVKAVTTTNADGSSTKIEHQTTPQTGIMQTLNNMKTTAEGIKSDLGGSPNNPPSTVQGTPVAGQTQGQADIQANLPQYQGGQQISGQGGANFGGLVGQLTNTSQVGNPNVSAAQTGLLGIGQQDTPEVAAARKELADFQTNAANQIYGLASSGMPLSEATGRQQALFQEYQAGLNARQQAVANALASQQQRTTALTGAGNVGNTAQQLAQTGLTGAAGLAQPQLAGFNQQAFNPLSGQFGSSQAGGQVGGQTGTALSQLPQQGQQAVQSYAQQIKTGSMTRADAESRLSAYGQVGINALNEALGTGFNTNASNASAATTATGQQIQTAAQATNQALDTLTTLFNNLSPAQTAGIPLTNSLANFIATELGDQALSQYKTNLADARSQLIGVLNSAGGTPTGNEATALQYLPDNMTKAQFIANVGTQQDPGIVRQLVAQKVASFTQSGQQNQNANTNTTGGLYSF